MSEKTTPKRGEDDRRAATKPHEDPAPRSPAPEDEDVKRGEDKLHSVTTK